LILTICCIRWRGEYQNGYSLLTTTISARCRICQSVWKKIFVCSQWLLFYSSGLWNEASACIAVSTHLTHPRGAKLYVYAHENPTDPSLH
jgi:hypothetical protein